MEQVEDKSPPDATAGCNDSLTKKEINEKEEPSPESLEASEAELEPEKEKPEMEKSQSKDSPNPDESYEEYHDSFEQQESETELDDFLGSVDFDDPQDDYNMVTYDDLGYIEAIKPKEDHDCTPKAAISSVYDWSQEDSSIPVLNPGTGSTECLDHVRYVARNTSSDTKRPERN